MIKMRQVVIIFVLGLCTAIKISSAAVMPPSPQRIVSMSLASDEILLAIIPECGGYSRVVGLSTFSDNPESSNIVNEAKLVKNRVHSELETIINLKPDLVIAASFNRQEVVRALSKKNIKVITLERFSSAIDIAENISIIGEQTNCKTAAESLRSKFLHQLNEGISSAHKKTRAPRLVNYSPDMTVMAKNTLFDDLVVRAGGINIASERGLSFWPKIDVETLLSSNPDFVIVTGNNSAEKLREIKNHAVWKKLTAVQEGRIIFIESKEALSTSHYFGKAVRDLRRKLRTSFH